jgi:regulatory LuxR family protein
MLIAYDFDGDREYDNEFAFVVSDGVASSPALEVSVCCACAEARRRRAATCCTPGAGLARAGAAGYLTKDRSLEQLVDAIRRVYRGGMYVSPSLGEVLAARLGGADRESAHDELSDREFQVLRGPAEGEPLKAIARRLEVSPGSSWARD